MQTTSALYKTLLRNTGHRNEILVNVSGTEYREDRIISLATSGGLFAQSTPSVGGCVSREFDLTFRPLGTIPTMAEIKIFTRLSIGTQASEWIPKGVFYIDTRSYDESKTFLTLHGFDAMLKAEQIFLPEVDESHWPRSMKTVAQEIAQMMGVSIDARTVINSNYTMDYPVDYTMREILGYIAAAHAANWTITDAGKLRMVGLADIPAETNYLVTEYGTPITFGGVKILV